MKILLLLLLALPSYAQFGAAKAVINGNGAPVSAECASANNVGRVYARKDGAAAGTTFYVCANTGASTYAWELGGGAADTAVMLSRATDQAGTDKYCRSTTTNDTYTCSVTPALTTYTTGGCLVLNPDTANTMTATLAVNGLAAKSILNRAVGALATGDITANAPISLCYDGTQFIIQGDGGGSGGGLTYTPTCTSDTVLTLPAIADGTMAVGTLACGAVASSTFTISSGTGTIWVGLASDCTVRVRHNIVGSCSAGCTPIPSASGFEQSDLPLYQWSVTTAVLAATGTNKLIPNMSVPLVAGLNISLATNNGITTITAASGGGITTGTTIPTTCAAGDMYYHTTYRTTFTCGVANFYEPTSWVSRTYTFLDEFHHAAESGANLVTDRYFQWVKAGANCTVFGATTSVDPYIGIANLPNGTGGSGACVMNVTTMSIPSAALSDFYYQSVFRLNRIAAQSKFFVGFATNGSTSFNPATRMGLTFDGATSTTALTFNVCNASTCTTSNSTVAASTGWVTMRIWRYNGNVFFSLNDETAVSLVATNIPASAIGYYLMTQNTDTTATSIDVDKVAAWFPY